ncbi:PilZ domain-containing protein [Paramagnetospirillum kuznetsovii]|uniref:PilZ domain-containing protein n=2 Tax=Paramagnetospirillum kuznetsovii TaxID=2053833 RepID=A0A364P0V7_9PROT|nr:PilZ domain-containing protein [Paramagnetospirillum kuznetsovii]
MDRRKLPRKVGQGLIVLIDGRAHTVIDISTAGIAFQTCGSPKGSIVSLKLAQLADISNCIEAKITVVSSQETITRGEFKPTMPLLRYIISHIGEATGTEPAYFRK